MTAEFQILDEGVVWKNPHPSVRSICAWHGHTENLGDGELIHAMRVGQAKSGLDGKVRILRSHDHGRTWAETTPLIAEEEDDAGFSYLTAFPRLASDGTLWASSLRLIQVEPEDPRWTPDNGGWIGGENLVFHSADKGHTWSKPLAVGPAPTEDSFPTLASPVHELASGELFLLLEAYFTQTIKQMRHQVTASYSRDRGKTWGEPVIVARDPEERLIYFDPRLARLQDGSWICLFWTHDRKTDETLNVTRSFSEDGYHWTHPEPTEIWGFPTLPLPLPDGRLLAVYNYRHSPQGIHCALSDDGGRSWDLRQARVLWDQEGRRISGALAQSGQPRAWEGSCMAEMFTWDFGVPDPILLDDGSILVTFYATQLDHVTHQRYVRLLV